MTAAAAAVREGPILFSGPMVRATLDDRKTMTRRVVTQHTSRVGTGLRWSQLDWSRVHVDPGLGGGAYLKVGGPDDTFHRVRCGYGEMGDRLWVRETWALVNDGGYAVDPSTLCYRVDGTKRLVQSRELLSHEPLQVPRDGWRSSIHMPRWVSRTTLDIADIRVERLQEITDADCEAEGVRPSTDGDGRDWRADENGWHRTYRQLWDSLNADRGFGWDVNPWVWVIAFKRVTP